MDQTETLRRTIDRMQAELTRLESIPDPALMPVETVLFWQQKMPLPGAWMGEPRTRSYMYVALKVPMNPTSPAWSDGACWYVTGSRGQERYTDDEMRNVLSHENTTDQYIVAEWLSLEEYEPTSPFDDDGIDYLTNNS
jgi:hypothetical protein